MQNSEYIYIFFIQFLSLLFLLYIFLLMPTTTTKKRKYINKNKYVKKRNSVVA